MSHTPAEIEERLIAEIISTLKKMRLWTKRMLVIATVASTICFIQAIQSAVHGRYEIAGLNLLLAIFNAVNGRTAYRRII